MKSLTPKEMQVLELLSKGFLYKEIAEKYEVTIDTVKKHSKNIYAKLNARNRTEAVIKMGQLTSSV
jgi:two-component system, NarL family, response regulator LiaR